MRISPAKLLILIALVLVFLVEGRTVLGFFDVEVSLIEMAIVGVFVVATLVGWAFLPRRNGR